MIKFSLAFPNAAALNFMAVFELCSPSPSHNKFTASVLGKWWGLLDTIQKCYMSYPIWMFKDSQYFSKIGPMIPTIFGEDDLLSSPQSQGLVS